MSVQGPSRQFDDIRLTSAFPPITAVKWTSQHFRKVHKRHVRWSGWQLPVVVSVFRSHEVIEALAPALARPKIINTTLGRQIDGGVDRRETILARVERRLEEFCG